MLDAIYISAIGLQAQKAQLDTTANNFANVGTTAYKRQSLDFSSVLDRVNQPSTGNLATLMGAGNAGRTVRLDLAQGELKATGRPLDVAISGPGFFEVDLGDNVTGYSRAGSLQINDDGVLTLAGGMPLKADVRIPRGAASVKIQADGAVTAIQEGDKAASVIGRIDLATFSNPEALTYRGDGLFVQKDDLVEATLNKPGDGGAGQLVPGSIESSNVQMVDEMVSLMLMQRVYELNSKVVQAADEMMGLTNSLRRS